MIDSNRLDQRESKVTVEQLHAYLRSKQWHEDGKIRNVATIWHRSDDEESEIVVPGTSARDYLPRIREALLLLADYEKRVVSDITKDVRRILSNIMTVRIIHDDTRNGTIPINDGVLLIAKAKELLSATAQSIYAKRKQFNGAIPKEAREYLDTLLLGQTEVGSYVVNVIAPTQSTVDVNSRTADTIPLGQVVAMNLVTSLEALEDASTAYEKNGDLKAFDIAVRSGASSNMCDALLGFSGERHHREFEITVTGTSVPMFANEPRKFTFNTHHVELLEKVSNYYKDDYVLPQRKVIGHITKLSRPKEKTSGTIVIDSTLNEVKRKISIELGEDDYHMAVLAHDHSKLIRVEGDIHVKSKSAKLLNPANFGVIENEDLF